MQEFFNSGRVPFARERLTVSNTASGLTASTYNGTQQSAPMPEYRPRATGAVVTVVSEGITATRNGTTPVAGTTGVDYIAGNQIILRSYTEIAKFQMIRNGSSDAGVEVEYFK